MADYYRLPCPNCGQKLRIRDQYVGLNVACKHCGRGFLFDPKQHGVEPDGGSSAPAPPTPTSDGETIERLEREVVGLREELHAALSAAARAAEERSAARLTRDERDRLSHEHEETLRALDHERSLAASLADELQRLRAERDEVVAEVESLRAECEAARHELREAVDRHESDIAEHRGAVESLQADRDRLEAERDRAAEQADSFRKEVEGHARLVESKRGATDDALRAAESSAKALAERLETAEAAVVAAQTERDEARERARTMAVKVEELERFKRDMSSTLGRMGIRLPG
jgi:chromosome segregation ATPase